MLRILFLTTLAFISAFFPMRPAHAVPDGRGNEIFLSTNVGIGTTTPQGGLVVTNGNVGIGTWAPGALLDVKGASKVSDGDLRITNGTAQAFTLENSTTTLHIGASSVPFQIGRNANTGETFIKSTQTASVPLTFYTRNVERMRIVDDNVGIGTTGTLASRLTIMGNVGIGTLGGAYVTNTAPANGMIIEGNVGVGTFSPNAKLIVSGGNVGIGSLAPGTPLDVNGVIRSISGGFTFPDGTNQTTAASGGGFTDGGTNVYTTTGSDNVGIGTSTPQGGLVVTNGNVGIGTWAPSDKLYIRGGITAFDSTVTAKNLTLGSNSGTGSIISGGSAGLMRFAAGGASDIQLQYTGTGNVGIGTFASSPDAMLHTINSRAIDSFRVDDLDGGDSSPFIIDAGGNVGIGTSSPFGGQLIIASGNVGIGSLTPGVPLDVNGVIRSISGGFTFPDGTTQTTAASGGGFTDAGGEVYLTTGSDNVGIGTTTPQGGLVVTNGNVGIGTWTSLNALTVMGNVGIGSHIAAAAVLHVQPSSDVDALIIRGSPSQSAGNLQEWQVAGGTVRSLVNSVGQMAVRTSTLANSTSLTVGIVNSSDIPLTLRGSATGNLQQWQNSSSVNLAVIDSAGNFGVGTANPVSKLTVNSGVGIGTGAAGTSAYLNIAPPAGGLIIQGNVGIGTFEPSEKLIISGGNVGIGTLTPGTPLDVNGIVRSISGGFTFPDGTTQTTAASGGGFTDAGTEVYSTTGSDNVGIGTTTPQGGFVVTNGNVGIGTWAPAAKLYVQEGTIIINKASTPSLTFIQGASNNSNISVISAADSGFLGAASGDMNVRAETSKKLHLGAGGGATTPTITLTTPNVGIGTTTPQGSLVVTNGNVGIGTWAPISSLDVIGSMSLKVAAKASNYTATAVDNVILVDASGGTVTITLPAAASSTGRLYSIKKTDSSSNSVIIDGNGAETIDGSTTISTTTQYQSFTIVCDGSNWYNI